MKKLLLIVAVLAATAASAQADSIVKAKNWKMKAIYGINGSQTAFVNWNAGGRNNVAILGFVDATANYKKGTMKWDNDAHLALGAVYFYKEDLPFREQFQKTDDRIEFNTNAGYRLKEHYYLSLLGNFRTQSLDGFQNPTDTLAASRFMAPGYATLALGIDYSPSDNFTLFVSPLAAKMTFVKSDRLANAGAFGVEPAVFDGLGNVITAGKQFRGEFGAYLQMKYKRNLGKGIDFKSALQLFSNYLDNPQNIDVNAETLLSFKVNEWLSTSLQWNLIYDDDIDIRRVKDDGTAQVGPVTQFKSVLGIGIAFSIQNYVDEKK